MIDQAHGPKCLMIKPNKRSERTMVAHPGPCISIFWQLLLRNLEISTRIIGDKNGFQERGADDAIVFAERTPNDGDISAVRR